MAVPPNVPWPAGAKPLLSRQVVMHTEATMDFSTFHSKAWDDHVTVAREVAQRLSEGVPLVTTESQLTQLANLAHHVHGSHLGEWRAGTAFIESLITLPPFQPEGTSGQSLRRYLASLALSAGDNSAAGLDTLSPSDRIQVRAMAAANLAEHDATRSMGLLQAALDQAARAGLDAADPMNRSLAVAGNNLACVLEEKLDRSDVERELMILAAKTARHYWAIAGTWLETERAEYRLAMTWLQAGDLAQARSHAQSCLEIVAANDGAALERLFGWEALGLVERAAGNPTGHAHALARAREAFTELEESEKAWCAQSIATLTA